MSSRNAGQTPWINHRSASLLLSAFVVSACVSTSPSVTPSRVEIQQDIGFTITEEAHANGNVRAEYDDALKLLEQGDLERGIAMLETVVETAPNLSAPRIDLGVAHHLAGNLEAAERNLLLALELNPDHPIAHNELGIVYRKTGRLAEARESYQSAISFYPGYHYAVRNLAILCDLYLVDFSCALDNYEAYMEIVTNDDQASMWIADLRMRMAQSEE